jgi:hypothetical protein
MAGRDSRDAGVDPLSHPTSAGAERLTARTASWLLRPTVLTPRQARGLLGMRLLAWGVDAGFGALVLHVANELVTNAVQHAGTDLELTVGITEPLLTVAVRDTGVGEPAIIPVTSDGRGWGLRMVAGLADRWGWTPSADQQRGKTVWAELPLR